MTETTAILAIDEGTTGTRAGWVTSDGRVGPLEYRTLPAAASSSPRVEADAGAIWAETQDAVQTTVARAESEGVRLVGLTISNQRATTVLWDASTGRPLAPAIGWQDTRYAERLAELAEAWDDRLLQRTGRGAGVRSTHLWLAEQLASETVARVHRRGDLRVGTVETWLIWKLTAGRSYVTTATNVCATGAYDLLAHDYATEWLTTLGVPPGVLPPIVDDDAALGVTDADVAGAALPILAAVGDQLAGLVGLGVAAAGDAACVHGTGSFIDIITAGRRALRASDGPTTLLALRAGGRSRYSVESYAPATGSSLRWLCETAGFFSEPAEVGRLASAAADSGGAIFVPALGGMRAPVVAPSARGAFAGLTLSTSREQIARAVLDGIAHSLVDGLELAASAAGRRPSLVVAGGGISSSDALLQSQADAGGIPVARAAASGHASLRGAAFVGGSGGLLWADLREAMATVRTEAVFEPSIGDGRRAEIRDRWQHAVRLELARAETERA